MNLMKPFKALAYPILPLVPECNYCAAMRFAFLSSIVTGLGCGWAFHHPVLGFFLGLAYGIIAIFTLWIDYKMHKGR